jgi:hypothetical protein
MIVQTVPASRFGWEGQTLEYVVKATGASELVAPAKCEEGLGVRVLETKRVSDGIEARVLVDVAGPVLY